MKIEVTAEMRERVAEYLSEVEWVLEQWRAHTKGKQEMGGEGVSREEELIEQVRVALPEHHLPTCSTSEQITVALALEEPELMPSGWRDSLTAYKTRLDRRQRQIVDIERGWEQD